MAKGVNRVTLIGYLGHDPESKVSQSGGVVVKLSVATNYSVKGADGQWTEETEWHRVIVFGRSAEYCRDYLRKGSQVYINGRLQTRKYQDQQGQERTITEVVANEVLSLGGKGGGQNEAVPNGNGGGYQQADSRTPRGGNGGQQYRQPPPPPQLPAPQSPAPINPKMDDDIPF